jgi:hypothetical protein
MRLLLFVLLSCFFMAAPSTALPQEFTGREHAHAMLLLSQSDKDVRLAAWSLYHVGSNRQDIFDLLAEVTWTACSGNRTMDSDTLSWLGKTLGNTKQARYAGLLDFCLSRAKDEKIKKYMKQARDNLAGTTSDFFEGGKIDLREAHARLTRKASLTSRDQISKNFDDLRQGQALEEVYSIFSPPDEVSATVVPGRKVGIPGVASFRIGSNRLAIGYSELGTIRFSYQEGQTDWKVADAKSVKGLFWSTIDGHFVTVNDQITSGDGLHLREIAWHLVEQDRLEKDILDRVAERIYRSRQEKDELLADGLAWLCRVIAKSGDGRYRQFLLQVSSSAGTSKLRNYASRTASSLKGTPGDSFVPASN